MSGKMKGQQKSVYRVCGKLCVRKRFLGFAVVGVVVIVVTVIVVVVADLLHVRTNSKGKGLECLLRARPLLTVRVHEKVRR